MANQTRLNKVLRLGFAAIVSALLALPLVAGCTNREPTVLVLLYHGLAKEPELDTEITPREFERHLVALKQNGYKSVSLTEFTSFIDGEADLPDKSVLITLDDGLASHESLARPILQEHNMKAVILPYAGRVGEPGYLDWSQIRDMLVSREFEIGAKGFKLDETDGGIVATGGVTFNFDDAWSSAYSEAFPLLEDAGIKATLFPIVEVLRNPVDGYMTLEQVRKVKDAGWEIGAHGMTHSDLTSAKEEELENELGGAKKYLEDQGFPAVSFAFPFGNYDAKTLTMAQDHYAFVRASVRGFNEFPLEFPLKAQVITSETTFEEAASWINEAKRDRKWVIIQFHQVDNEGREFATTPAILSRIVDHVVASGLPAPIMSEVNGRLLVLPQREDGRLEDKSSYRQRLLDDFRRSRRVISAETGRAPRSFAYPFGVKNNDIERAVRRAGYKNAFSATEGSVEKNSDAFEIKRITVDTGTDMEKLLADPPR
ncbi:MAG: polysaccharide deacetylase family protein [Terriglobia bacterium]